MTEGLNFFQIERKEGKRGGTRWLRRLFGAYSPDGFSAGIIAEGIGDCFPFEKG